MDAFQARSTECAATAVVRRLPGTLGAVVSGAPVVREAEGDPDGPPPAHGLPLSLQYNGIPEPLATNPNVALAFGATVPLYSRFLNV